MRTLDFLQNRRIKIRAFVQSPIAWFLSATVYRAFPRRRDFWQILNLRYVEDGTSRDVFGDSVRVEFEADFKIVFQRHRPVVMQNIVMSAI